MGVFLLLYLSRTERTALSIMSFHLGFSGRVVLFLSDSYLSALLHLPQENHTASGAERRAGFRLHSIHLPIARGQEGSLLDSPYNPPAPAPATLCHFRWPSSRAPAANWGSLVSSQSFSCRRPADHQAWCTNEVFSVIVLIRRTKQEIFDALGLFHPHPLP